MDARVRARRATGRVEAGVGGACAQSRPARGKARQMNGIAWGAIAGDFLMSICLVVVLFYIVLMYFEALWWVACWLHAVYPRKPEGQDR